MCCVSRGTQSRTVTLRILIRLSRCFQDGSLAPCRAFLGDKCILQSTFRNRSFDTCCCRFVFRLWLIRRSAARRRGGLLRPLRASSLGALTGSSFRSWSRFPCIPCFTLMGTTWSLLGVTSRRLRNSAHGVSPFRMFARYSENTAKEPTVQEP